MKDLFIAWITIQLITIWIMTATTEYDIKHNQNYCINSDAGRFTFGVAWALFPLVSFVPEDRYNSKCITK